MCFLKGSNPLLDFLNLQDAPRPWGMQPNTSSWRLAASACAFLRSCLRCILYHFWGCLRLSVVVASIDLHSSKPCFSVEFVDTYSIHSFPPPSRRTQQTQGFQRSGAGVCPQLQTSINTNKDFLTLTIILKLYFQAPPRSHSQRYQL